MIDWNEENNTLTLQLDSYREAQGLVSWYLRSKGLKRQGDISGISQATISRVERIGTPSPVNHTSFAHILEMLGFTILRERSGNVVIERSTDGIVPEIQPTNRGLPPSFDGDGGREVDPEPDSRDF